MLILELALEVIDRFIPIADERAIEQVLLELLPHCGVYQVYGISKRVIAAVASEIRGANLRNDAAPRENHLRRLDLHIVGALDTIETIESGTGAPNRSSRRHGRRRRGRLSG